MKRSLLLLSLFTAGDAAVAQDFYDVDVLRTVDLTFHDAGWWTKLQQNYSSQTNILADLTVESVVYPDVGVRIRGNTSYTWLPPGSQKVSLNVEVDFVHDGQEVMGYKNLNFNNAFTDPTFCREVVFSNILAQWIPNGRANHIVLTLNGQNWGVYANVQQFDKTMLEAYFDDEDGMRVKCANNPNGPGLQYFGSNPSSYSVYEIKDDGGLADPVGEIIAICNAVDNTPPANWALVDQIFAVDPSSWTVALENLYSDDDSYVNKGCDFVMYRDPVDGRSRLLQTDGNESWREANWAADHHFSQSSKPFLNKVLASSEMRSRYYAHLSAAMEDFDWSTLGAEFTARRNLIDAAVQADPKKLYSYQAFVNNFTTTVNLGGGPFGGNVIGLQQYVTQRRALLLADPEIAANRPTIAGAAMSTNVPLMPIHVTATVTGIDPVQRVTAYTRPDPSLPFQSTPMLDDGLSGDGAAGDGVYGALLPFTAVAGQKVSWYVGAMSANVQRAQSFAPARTELAPYVTAFTGGTGTSDVVINEFLAKNDSVIQDPSGSWEDYVELYNRGAATVDLSGMYMTDKLSNPTKWQIPAGTMLGAGQTLLIWADEDLGEGPLHGDFKLSTDGEEIGLFDVDGATLLDSVVFGAQEADVSTGRLEDGGDLWVTFPAPTPDLPNEPGCGVRAYDQLDPAQHTLTMTAAGGGSLGSTLTFTTDGFLASTSTFFAYGVAPLHVQVTPEIVALMSGNVVFAWPADAAGVATVPLPLPTDTGLIGKKFYFQAAGIDAGGAVGGSNAVHLTICP